MQLLTFRSFAYEGYFLDSHRLYNSDTNTNSGEFASLFTGLETKFLSQNKNKEKHSPLSSHILSWLGSSEFMVSKISVEVTP